MFTPNNKEIWPWIIISFAWPHVMAPTTNPGIDESVSSGNFPLFQCSERSRTYHAIIARTTKIHSRILGTGATRFWCGSMEYMFWGGQCTSKYGLAMARHNSSVSPHALLENAAASSTAHTYIYVCFKGFMMLRHGLGARERFKPLSRAFCCLRSLRLGP
jgi:hypothetical protein